MEERQKETRAAGTNSGALWAAMETAGTDLPRLAAGAGMRPGDLRRKIQGEAEFTAGEMEAVGRRLGLSGRQRQAIFFAPDVDSKSTAAEEEDGHGQRV